MKATRKELMDFLKWNEKEFGYELDDATTGYQVDRYLKSINSETGDETPTVTDNEAKRKKCNCTKFPRPLYWERGKCICGNCDGLA